MEYFNYELIYLFGNGIKDRGLSRIHWADYKTDTNMMDSLEAKSIVFVFI